MTWLQALKRSLPEHKYAINTALLGEQSVCAWSNLGDWSACNDYAQACQQLACRAAEAVQLTAHDRVLDLGCGQGASVLLWLNHFKVENVSAVELQPSHVAHIQQHIPQLQQLMTESFLNLNALAFEFKFDVLLCIDAAYHSDLNLFLSSCKSVLNSNGRLAFHYLILTEKFNTLTPLQQRKYRYLLKAADIDLLHLSDQAGTVNKLQQQGFQQIKIDNLSKAVLHGFALYWQRQRAIPQSAHLTLLQKVDFWKIDMTAKLCAKLYQEGVIDYVQIRATSA